LSLRMNFHIKRNVFGGSGETRHRLFWRFIST